MSRDHGPCRCGHPHEAHVHYRRGSDCGSCGAETCASYRPVEGGGLARVRAWLTRGR